MDEFRIQKILSSVEYGFISKNRERRTSYENFSEDYILQTPTELLESLLGVCWDQVELERYYFEKATCPFKTYYIVYIDNEVFPTHTFLAFEKNNKYYWFENSFEKYRGIHEYKSLNELLKDVRNKFVNFYNRSDTENVEMFEYSKPNYHLNVNEFTNHCTLGNIIKLEEDYELFKS